MSAPLLKELDRFASDEPTIDGVRVTLEVDPDGGVSGSAGCNDYSGGFTAYDTNLRVSNVGVTGALCGQPDGVDQQESTYLSLLQRAVRFSVSAGQLSVFDSAGNRILTYVSG